MQQITVRDLSLGYEGKMVFENLNFTVSSGQYLCIVGTNGSGKTTLIKALLGLKAPRAGSIDFAENLRAGGVGYLPQQTPVQRDFPASVQEIVLSGCLNRHTFRSFYTPADRALARGNMEKLGIFDLAEHSYRDLSGGLQQRVLLARALCATRSILLLDEPTAGLDPNATLEMYELIATLNREHGVTVIMVTHDFPAAVKYASHILHIGHDPVFFGSTAEYLKSDAMRRFAPAAEGCNNA